jgi:hypothetical protein
MAAVAAEMALVPIWMARLTSRLSLARSLM